MRSIRHGLLAGALAGLLLVILLFFDEGPGNQLGPVAQSFGLNERGESKLVAALLMFGLGTIVGGLFGALWRQRSISRGWAMLWGWVAGLLWWAILFVFLGSIAQGVLFSVYGMLLYLVLSLVYGLVLGSLYTTMQR